MMEEKSVIRPPSLALCYNAPVSEQFRIVYDPDPRVWDDFVCARGGHLLQSAAWGELKARFGWTARRIALERDGVIIAGAQILFRRLPLGLQFAYVPRGPVADPQDREALAELLDALCAAARERGAFALKIEPNWLGALPLPFRERDGRKSSRRFKFKDLVSPMRDDLRGVRVGTCFQPRTTFHVDLARDLDSILAQMKPKWRYNIRLAERKRVQVRAGGADDLALFYQLLQITSQRDGFAIHSFDYYRAAFDLLTANDRARLLIAEYAREPLAAIFITAFGREAIYLYGASSNAHRERMPNHALHWAAMQWTKARGCAYYDLWGVGATAEANVGAIRPERSAAESKELPQQHGLYQFKQGFGGSVVRYVGAYDAIFSRIKFALYERALAMRRGALG